MNKHTKRGCVLVALGLCMVLAGTAMYMMYRKQDSLAGQNASALLDQFKANRHLFVEAPERPGHSQPMENPEAATGVPGETQPQEMPEMSYSGYSIIGILRVPSLGLELPVLKNWSYPLLNVAPCRYSGNLADGNLIIMGHNYASHFTPLHYIELGTAVEFEDAWGNVHRFVVETRETLHKTQGEDLPSDYPLSLFTCTAGGQSRLVIRCGEAPK